MHEKQDVYDRLMERIGKLIDEAEEEENVWNARERQES